MKQNLLRYGNESTDQLPIGVSSTPVVAETKRADHVLRCRMLCYLRMTDVDVRDEFAGIDSKPPLFRVSFV